MIHLPYESVENKQEIAIEKIREIDESAQDFLARLREFGQEISLYEKDIMRKREKFDDVEIADSLKEKRKYIDTLYANI